MIKTINARNIKDFGNYFEVMKYAEVGDAIGHLMIMIYEWAERNKMKVIGTCSFMSPDGFDICILLV